MSEAEKIDLLTSREQKIMNLLLDGLSLKEIAGNLKISINTVDFHRGNLYRKLGIQSLQELFSKYLNREYDLKAIAHFCDFSPVFDDRSTANVIRSNEEIDGQIEDCLTVSGILADHLSPHSGARGELDDSTLQAVKTMKFFTFKVLGDGNIYFVMLQTTDTIKIKEDHWFFAFPTVKNKIVTITVNIPIDLVRMGFSGTQVEFIQNNIEAISFQVVNPSQYKLKVWDIKLYRQIQKAANNTIAETGKDFLFTSREQEIMNLLLDGLSLKEIAGNLKISQKTVDFHRGNLYRKLDIQCLQDLFAKYLNKDRHYFKVFAFFYHFAGICDDDSTIAVTRSNEEIDGQIENCVTISGTRLGAFSGTFGWASASTLSALKTMKCFTFKVLGDGNSYFVGLPTKEIEDCYLYTFPTVKDKVITVTVNVPEDLIRIGYTGTQLEFIQNDIRAMCIQVVNSGPFKLKFWDIRLYQ